MDKELINSHTKIKICGMTCEADIKAVNTYLPDYIGFVLFFPKSNRNISIEQAEHLLEKVDKKIRTVAVVVSPTTEQIRQIEKAGFDYIQIHGTVTEDVYKQCKLPILRAFNVSDLDKLDEYEAKDKIKAMYLTARHLEVGKHLTGVCLIISDKDKRQMYRKMFLIKKTKKRFFLQEELMKRM